jgi:flagellar motor switch protein FliG
VWRDAVSTMLRSATQPDRDVLATPRRPFEDLPSHVIGRLLVGETPRVAASVLANLPDDQARWIFGELRAGLQDGVVRCWASADLETDPDGIRAIEERLGARLRERPITGIVPGGPDLAARLLCLLARPERDDRLAALLRSDPASCAAVRERILEFEDLALLAPDDMRRLLERVDPSDVADAVRGESLLVQGAFVDRLAMSRALVVRRMLEEPARRERGPWSRRRILEIAAVMIDEGRIGWPEPVGA